MISDALIRDIRKAAGITRIAEITGLDYVGVPVISVIRPAARSLSVASGKGQTYDQALASGVFEAFEQFCAEHAELPVLQAPRDQHRTDHRFLDPATLPADRRARVKGGRDVRWTPAVRLRDQSEILVPYDLVHLNLTADALASSDGFLASTNGLAAGMNRDNAILHALCEVVERDAIAVAGHPKGQIALRKLASIDLESVEEGDCKALIEYCEKARIAIHAWDATSDIGVPVIYCRVSERTDSAYALAPPTDGSGCDPQPVVALRRAITEALQSRLTLISGVRDDILRRYYGTRRSASWSAVDATRGSRGLQQLPHFQGEDTSSRISWVLSRLAASGFTDACYVDVTRSPVAAATVRVIVPGLEGMKLSRGYLPGCRARAAGRALCEGAHR